MHYEGPRRQGRFIKNGSKVMDKVSLVDFSFKEINDAKVITLDNAKRNIVHASYHDEIELKESVTHPEKFNDNLTPREHMRAVIFPMDFTKEWERDKKMRKDRVSRQDDDEYDYELEAAQLAEQQQAEAAAKANGGEAPSVAEDVKTEVPTAAVAQPLASAAPATPLVKGPTTQWESMAVVGKAIKGFLGSEDEVAQAASPAPSPPPAKSADDFIPTQAAPAAHGQVVDPEAAAAEDYKARVELLKTQESKLQELVDEAKAKGYRDGFRMGEEKAELQARQNATALFGKVTELIHEFGNLKQDVLNNVQENFYELCQAMAETLLKREFSINPETFVTVLRRAIAEAVEPGKFRIRVNPETYDRVAGLGTSDIVEALMRDSEVAVGDFKIESQMSIVDVSITKMIKELLDQADLNLFQTEKAG